eukprot:2737183-Rhodomonas_salina.1
MDRGRARRAHQGGGSGRREGRRERIVLCACYAMTDTDSAYGATRNREKVIINREGLGHRDPRSSPLSAYARAMRCLGMVVPEGVYLAMCTEIGYGGTMGGVEMGYGGTMGGTEMGYGGTLCGTEMGFCGTMSGTEIGYG